MSPKTTKTEIVETQLKSGRFIRFLVEQVWLWGLFVYVGFFAGIVFVMNRWDLSAVPVPRLVQAVLALISLMLVLWIPHRVWRSRFLQAKKDIELIYQAKLCLREIKRWMRTLRKDKNEGAYQKAQQAFVGLKKVLAEQKDPTSMMAFVSSLSPETFEKTKKTTWIDYMGSVGTALLIALILRGFVIGNFVIPSGSMIPTLQIGDQLFVNQLIYGIGIPFTHYKLGSHLRPPRHGEVIVFGDTKGDILKDLIKRVIAVPGDRVRLCSNSDDIWVNEQKLTHTIDSEAATSSTCQYDDNDTESRQLEKWERLSCRYAMWEEHGGFRYRVQKTDRVGNVRLMEGHQFVADQFQMDPQNQGCYTYQIPKDHVFVMGDNRDRSLDGRAWGLVPYQNIKGKALFIWWSEGVRWQDRKQQPYARFERVLRPIHSPLR